MKPARPPPSAARSQAAAGAAAQAAVWSLSGVLVARLPAQLEPERMAALREALLARQAQEHCRHVVLDLGEVELLDGGDLEDLRRLLAAVSLLGARPALAAVQPGAAACLAEADPRFLGRVTVLRGLDEVATLTGDFAGDAGGAA